MGVLLSCDKSRKRLLQAVFEVEDEEEEEATANLWRMAAAKELA